VQVIPHVTDEIKQRIIACAKQAEQAMANTKAIKDSFFIGIGVWL
jgi:CTP synthase (UTP-ammonia lyase)